MSYLYDDFAGFSDHFYETDPLGFIHLRGCGHVHIYVNRSRWWDKLPGAGSLQTLEPPGECDDTVHKQELQFTHRLQMCSQAFAQFHQSRFILV